VAGAVVAAGAVDKETMMNTADAKRTCRQWPLVVGVTASLSAIAMIAAPLDVHAQGAAGAPRLTRAASVKAFDTPKQAADALLAAAAAFDVGMLQELFGPLVADIVLSGTDVEDRERAAEFVTKAREKASVSVDPTTRRRAFLLMGNDAWPFPIPIVKRGNQWSFDTEAGLEELQIRRIGRNELDAIELCRGYVEAQHEYALKARKGFEVNQYAQRIISTPGTQDGLAWRNADGTWGGPVGEDVARAIERGYTDRTEPYRGYFFKILKGQGPAAPLGQMDFVVKNVMIGGFALIAAPAEYGVTGVKTFMVSHDGVVYEKDLGKATLDAFKRTERFNPDKSWTPVE
jgi:Protein of unknown function (DUF2950)